MATQAIQSLGDESPQDLVLVRDSRELPRGRVKIIEAISAILNLGGVQRVTVEVGRPLNFWRLVPKGQLLPEIPEEVLKSDRLGTVYQSPMEEFACPAKYSSTKYLLEAFNKLADQDYTAEFFVVPRLKAFCSWLGVKDRKNAFGVPIEVDGDLPEDAFLLVAHKTDNEGDVLSLRMDMSEPTQKGAKG